MRTLKILVASAVVLAGAALYNKPVSVQASAGPAEQLASEYRVLAPIESGALLLFPVVRTNGTQVLQTPFLTLDEGIASGEVEVTEAGKARGLVRPRPAVRRRAGSDGNYAAIPEEIFDRPERGDQVNTLVQVNHSKRPLLLLAGEIVTGGKQDRVIAKDRIVPAGSEPIDLGAFCIEPGRWTERSAVFGASNKSQARGIMVQPAVRQRAMVEKDQQQVWASVHGVIASAGIAPRAASPSMAYDGGRSSNFGTTSYAQVMQQREVSGRVDQAAAPAIQNGEKNLAKLRAEHAVGVVVAIHGEVVWADVFASTDLLARYWTKLVRSYAAESLTASEGKGQATIADAQRFLDAPASGTEQSEGVVGVYRYLELKSGRTEMFVLESLLPEARYAVHTSRLLLQSSAPHKSRRVVIEERPIR